MHETQQNAENPEQRHCPWAVDVHPEDRPGVPRETAPHPLAGTHWTEPPHQPIRGIMPIRAELDCPTPVFSTALPTHGLSGKIRGKAYGISDAFVRHWLLLLFADRVEALETVFKPSAEPAPKTPSTSTNHDQGKTTD